LLLILFLRQYKKFEEAQSEGWENITNSTLEEKEENLGVTTWLGLV